VVSPSGCSRREDERGWRFSGPPDTICVTQIRKALRRKPDLTLRGTAVSVGELLALLAPLPDDAQVPVGWLRSHLAEDTTAMPPESLPAPLATDLSAKQVGVLFGRSPATVRLWAEQGQLVGAWKLNGKAWRVPVAAVEQFRRDQRAPAPTQLQPSTGDLGDWRRHRKPA
jgi:hypothetical protein